MKTLKQITSLVTDRVFRPLVLIALAWGAFSGAEIIGSLFADLLTASASERAEILHNLLLCIAFPVLILLGAGLFILAVGFAILAFQFAFSGRWFEKFLPSLSLALLVGAMALAPTPAFAGDPVKLDNCQTAHDRVPNGKGGFHTCEELCQRHGGSCASLSRDGGSDFVGVALGAALVVGLTYAAVGSSSSFAPVAHITEAGHEFGFVVRDGAMSLRTTDKGADIGFSFSF